MTRVLILGGTADARRLAALATAAGFDVTSSLAGRTTTTRQALEGAVRVGGFGGVEGLVDYLRAHEVDLLVDATHPFAAQMSAHAAEATAITHTPCVMIARPRWERVAGDRWVTVHFIEEAAAALPGLARRVFLAIGRQELAAFAHLADLWFLCRMIERPAEGASLPPGEIVLDRGPFTEAGDRALLEAHRIEVVVSRNSGGAEAYSKIAAARDLGLPVVIIDRPALPPGERVDDVAGALAWIEAHAVRV